MLVARNLKTVQKSLVRFKSAQTAFAASKRGNFFQNAPKLSNQYLEDPFMIEQLALDIPKEVCAPFHTFLRTEVELDFCPSSTSAVSKAICWRLAKKSAAKSTSCISKRKGTLPEWDSWMAEYFLSFDSRLEVFIDLKGRALWSLGQSYR